MINRGRSGEIELLFRDNNINDARTITARPASCRALGGGRHRAATSALSFAIALFYFRNEGANEARQFRLDPALSSNGRWKTLFSQVCTAKTTRQFVESRVARRGGGKTLSPPNYFHAHYSAVPFATRDSFKKL